MNSSHLRPQCGSLSLIRASLAFYRFVLNCLFFADSVQLPNWYVNKSGKAETFTSAQNSLTPCGLGLPLSSSEIIQLSVYLRV